MRNQKSGLTAMMFGLLVFASAQSTAPSIVPITKEPSHHMVLDNEYVRVFYVEVPPHAETQYHQHDKDYIFVTLGDASVDSVRVGEKPVHLDLKDGDVQFSKAPFAHKAVNVSVKPFRNYTIEIKHQTKLEYVWPTTKSGLHLQPMSCEKFGDDGEFRCSGVVVSSDDLKCSTFMGGLKTSFVMENDRPFLLLPNEHALLASIAHDPSNKEQGTLIAKAGSVLWVNANDIHRHVHNSAYGNYAVCTFKKL